MRTKVVLATDFSKENYAVVDFALNNCNTDNFEVTFLHVVSDDGFSNPPPTKEDRKMEIKYKENKLMDLTEDFVCKTKEVILIGDIKNRIKQFIQDNGVDMLVIGHKKLNFLDRLLKRSISKELMKEAPCPIVYC